MEDLRIFAFADEADPNFDGQIATTCRVLRSATLTAKISAIFLWIKRASCATVWTMPV